MDVAYVSFEIREMSNNISSKKKCHWLITQPMLRSVGRM